LFCHCEELATWQPTQLDCHVASSPQGHELMIVSFSKSRHRQIISVVHTDAFRTTSNCGESRFPAHPFHMAISEEIIGTVEMPFAFDGIVKFMLVRQRFAIFRPEMRSDICHAIAALRRHNLVRHILK